jgi:hypothetical protein
MVAVKKDKRARADGSIAADREEAAVAEDSTVAEAEAAVRAGKAVPYCGSRKPQGNSNLSSSGHSSPTVLGLKWSAPTFTTAWKSSSAI